MNKDWNRDCIAILFLTITFAVGCVALPVKFYAEGKQAKAEVVQEVEVIAKIEEPATLELVPVMATYEAHEPTIPEMIEEVAGIYNICPELIEAVIEVESGFDANAVSPCGAVGLMQIVPKWHRSRMEALGVDDLKDPYSNILVGTDILADLFEEYGDDVYLVLMCYNEGKYGTAVQRAEAGEFSHYARKIVERSAELERLHEQEEAFEDAVDELKEE